MSAALAAMYPSAADTTPASSAAQQAAAAVAAPPAQPAAPEAVQPTPSIAEAAASIYGDEPPTRELVRWSEPAADAKAIAFDVPEHADRTEAGDAERRQLAEAMAAAGAGPTLARELYGDVVRAARPGFAPPAPDVAAIELRRAWGGAFDRNLAAARALVAQAAAKDPSIIPFLDRTGLGNDPAFIRKIAARAAKAARP